MEEKESFRGGLVLPEVEEKYKGEIERFRTEMKAKGYPEGMIEKAIERAKGWVTGISQFADARYPELTKRIQEEMFPEALWTHGEKWMKELMGVFEIRVGEVI